MSEDPQDLKNVKPSGDSARGAEPSQPADPVLPGNSAQGEDDLSPTGGESVDRPLERFTGALRGDNIPPEETSQGASLPPVQPASGLPSAEPGTPAAVPLFGAEDEQLIESESGDLLETWTERVTGSLRSTGPIRDAGHLRGTRPLSEDDLRGVESAGQARGGEPAAGAPAGEGEVLPREEPGPAAQGSGSLLERLTGTLRRTTGMLRRSDPERETRGTRPLSPEELGDKAVQPGAAPVDSSPEALHDESDLLPRADAAAGAEDELRRSKPGTGSLMERLTGSLRQTTGQLRRPDTAQDAGSMHPTYLPKDTGSLRGAEPLQEPDLPQDAGPLPQVDRSQDTGSLRRTDLPEEPHPTPHAEAPLWGDLSSIRDELSLEDNASLSEDNAPLSEDNAPLPESSAPLPEGNAPLPEDNGPLFEDNTPLFEPDEPSRGADLPSSGPALRTEFPQAAAASEDADSGPLRSTGPMRDSGHLRGTRPLSEDELRDLSSAMPEAAAPAETGQPVLRSSTEMAGSEQAGGEMPRGAEVASSGQPPAAGPDRPGSTRGEERDIRGEGRAQPLEEEPDLTKSGTSSLLERLTGTLRKTTGELLGTGSLRRTGPLREPGAKEGEGGAKSRRPVMDESLTELRQALTSEETEQVKRGRGTGRLFERITGSLRKVTGSLRKTDKLRGQGAADAEAALPDAAVTGEGAAPAVTALPDMPEIGDDMLAGRLAGAEATAPREPGLPADWSESPWFTGISEVEPAQDEEEASEPGAQLFAEAPGVAWETGSAVEPRWPGEADSETEYTPEAPELSEPLLSGDEPISLLDSGAIAALGQAEEEERQAGAPDWVSEIRHEVAEEEEAGVAEADEKPRHKGMTGQLRSFISGILRGGEDKEKAAGAEQAPEGAGEEPAAETPAIQSNEEWQAYIAAAAAGQLGLAQDEDLFEEEEELPTGEEQPAVEELPAGVEQPEGEQPLVDELPAASQMDEDAFAARFGVLGEAAEQPAETPSPYALSPEEEALLWGAPDTLDSSEPGQVTLPSPDELWEEPQSTEEEAELPAPDLRDQQGDIESLTLRSTDRTERVTSSLFGDVTEDAYAAAYLTGDDLKPAESTPVSQDRLLHEALDRTSAQPEEAESIEELRAIAMEDYEEVAEIGAVETEEQAYQVPVEPEQMAVTPAEEEALGLSEPMPVKQSWWAARSLAEKVLIIEAAVVALVLLIAIPLYTFLVINRVQTRQTASLGPLAPISLIRPTPLPAEIPHPTGIVLPGGWYFALTNSTFVKGEWKPVSSEWKEDTELRRVVALPWNPQTDAVIRTFKPGDRIQVNLSNNKSQIYKIEEIKRVPITDTAVLDSNKPSLAIILYNEAAAERWVVLCKP